MKRSNVRRGAPWMTAALALALTACGGDDPMDPMNGGDGNGNGGSVIPMTTAVSVQDNFFDPAANRVSSGASVTWTWNGSNPHNVTFTDGSIDSSDTQTAGTFSATMPTATGTYTYRCTIHSGMDGAVTVE